ncbi:MAG: FG-GAP-like repeat-containing protein [Bacteroidales bacterium]|nr:FG-GAP-like repeat-containing protein [Bacteroidales bacterium]MDZ4204360.1 FG-GAP-like repeat-containing protein [Bacteroidales bacterium]
MKIIYLFFLMIPFILALTSDVHGKVFDRDWTILATYTITGKASGLAWDGTFLYFGIYGTNGDKVYRFDPSNGSHQLQFSNPAIGDSYGMTYDGSHLWIVDRGSTGPSFAKKLDMAGNIVSQIQLPDQYMSGIAWDDGNFWACTYYPDPGVIYKISNNGIVLTQFPPPNTQTWDICKENENLWVVDYNAYKIYKISQTGTILETQNSQSQRPAGIVFDGTYLWYVDGPLSGNSTLYKVDLGGAGTPIISIPVTNHNFGTVTVGTSSTWMMSVSNNGTAPLNLSVQIPTGVPVSSTASTTIQPVQNQAIPVVFSPVTPGPLYCVAQVISNDPVNPSVNITLEGYAVTLGPNLHLPLHSHDFGTIRTNATKRWNMQIQNTGNSTLTINSFEFDDNHFFLDDQIQLPINLAPLGTADVNIWFWPGQSIHYNSTLNVFSNTVNQNPLPVSLSGAGLDADYPIGASLWQYNIIAGSDNSPKAIISIPDINGDGVADVIICSEDNYVRCFNGNASVQGQVLWEKLIYSGSVYQQSALATTGDINNDSYPDVVIGTAWGDRSIIALSGKTGVILWKHQTNNYGTGGWVYAVCTKFDYNGDGFPDVLAVTGNDSNGQGPRRVYCLNGKTGVPIWEHFLGAAGFSVIGINDANGDGIPDVVAGATNAAETQGKVVGISGANGSQLWSFNTTGTSVFALEFLDDIDGDGIKDVVAGTFNGTVYYINAVNGSILHQASVGNNLILNLTRLEDVSGDGYADIMPGHSGTLAVMLNGFNAGTIWTKSMPDKPWNVARIADVSFDGINDVVVGTLYQNNFVYILNGTNGNDLFSTNYGEAVDAIGAIPDIAGDLTWEMMAGGRNGKVVCYSGGINPWVGIPSSEEKITSLRTNCFPNPFSIQTTITFELPSEAKVTVKIFDLTGTVLWQTIETPYPKGINAVSWNAVNSAGQAIKQGIYIYEVETPVYSRKGKIIFMGH